VTKTSFESYMTVHSQADLIEQLMTLLDRIEIEENWELVYQRFDIMREFGSIKFCGPSSAKIN